LEILAAPRTISPRRRSLTGIFPTRRREMAEQWREAYVNVGPALADPYASAWLSEWPSGVEYVSSQTSEESATGVDNVSKVSGELHCNSILV
jgi:hypothetical protein